MKSIRQKFSVSFDYTVHFTEGIFNEDNPILAELLRSTQKAKVFFVVDEGVAVAHPSLTQSIRKYCKAHEDNFYLCASPLILPGGEAVKNDPKFVEQILNAINNEKIDRHSFIVAIGGGAVLDMAGFAAAVGHRGIKHIRIPTTVLAQNDSGVGVKNSINAFDKKNFLGTFAPPFAVVNDSLFLETLSDRDWRSGISEAVKVALIKDISFFEWLERNAGKLASRDMMCMEELVFRCAKMHLDHIASGDPFESGSSRPLDFGHWAAHKLEQLSSYELRHGEAVAIGICLDAAYSHLKGSISSEELDRIINLSKTVNLPFYCSELTGENLLHGLEEFREHLGGRLTIMILEGLGRGKEVHEMDGELIFRAAEKLKEYQQLQKS